MSEDKKEDAKASNGEAPAEEAVAAKPAVAMIHVRFAPDGMVTEIGERPTSLSPQDWFNRLSDKAGTHYQPLSGGRGIFRIPPDEVETLKSMSTN